MTETDEEALASLLKTRQNLRADVPESLVRECFAIEKKCLFDQDREISLLELRKAIQGFLDQEPAKRTKGGRA
jgi:hypothetical protein